jgi:hypothetical protein
MMTKKKLPGYVGPRPHFCIMQHDGGWYARADFWAVLAGLLFVFPLPFAFIPSPFIPLTPESAVKKCFPTLPYRRIIAFPRFPPIHTYVTHEKTRAIPPIGSRNFFQVIHLRVVDLFDLSQAIDKD